MQEADAILVAGEGYCSCVICAALEWYQRNHEPGIPHPLDALIDLRPTPFEAFRWICHEAARLNPNTQYESEKLDTFLTDGWFDDPDWSNLKFIAEVRFTLRPDKRAAVSFDTRRMIAHLEWRRFFDSDLLQKWLSIPYVSYIKFMTYDFKDYTLQQWAIYEEARPWLYLVLGTTDLLEHNLVELVKEFLGCVPIPRCFKGELDTSSTRVVGRFHVRMSMKSNMRSSYAGGDRMI
jgi:hypothetical protein